MIQTVLGRVFPRSLGLRLLAVAFVGIHTPLILLAVWMFVRSELPREEAIVVLLVVLAATLLGTAITLLVMHRMLAPLRHAFSMLELAETGTGAPTPRLPEAGDDEVGRLLRSFNRSLQGAKAGMRDLAREAQTDPLTSALNRRGSEQALADSVQRAEQQRGPFVLVVVDLDNLKQVNDQLGHSAGDAVLTRLTRQAQRWLGPGDWFGRWGGDEFLIGLHLEVGEACARVEAWRLALEQGDEDDQQPVFLSAGVAAHHHGEDSQTLYRRADAAMYRAKFGGGRRLRLDPATSPPP
ncbi:diguanylate cyclase (GGDEF) domain-containing protein [Pseudoxanthomonas sp. GM95]|uniref:GGDEF domain-containing protein n=1 Tax=Pseudoxanthomonas sp. GM95 TaxID=1881043 RepID=UPI0008B253FE|nr:GGDEF domain-containing protein [Pseudoxanthomonas sp. GM95]SEK49046.1 diguanylate cyclase (GGDEF) domain-containing protein [Pseudoxanthomonas sp. GM95]